MDDSIKVVLFHGGKYYSSGNDIKSLAGMLQMSPEEMKAAALRHMSETGLPLLQMLTGFSKPSVAVVRGGCLGIMFTSMVYADFIYCAPDAFFQCPFMRTFQSPEGSSTLTFPEVMGRRKTSEVLMLEKTLSAKEAVECGFATEILPELQSEPEWFDLAKVPAIGKLLKSDHRTLMNMKRQLLATSDKNLMRETLERENNALLDSWLQEGFSEKLGNYIMQLMQEKKKAKL